MARLEVGDRRGREGRRLGEDPGAEEGSFGRAARQEARFAAGLDKPKVFEAAPKAEAKGDKPKADKPKDANAPKAEKLAKAPSKDAGDPYMRPSRPVTASNAL